jgi:hypothetical protein
MMIKKNMQINEFAMQELKKKSGAPNAAPQNQDLEDEGEDPVLMVQKF